MQLLISDGASAGQKCLKTAQVIGYRTMLQEAATTGTKSSTFRVGPIRL